MSLRRSCMRFLELQVDAAARSCALPNIHGKIGISAPRPFRYAREEIFGLREDRDTAISPSVSA